MSLRLPRPLLRLPSLAAAALVYLALAAAVNPAAAQAGDAGAQAGLDALRVGEMRGLVVPPEAQPAPDTAFTAADGQPTTLAASNGKVRLVNFWATWCAPCRQEMPSLEALARERGGADLAVLTIATGRNTPDAIERFRAETGISALPNALDPRGDLARAMSVPGLPVTVLLDRQGNEVARLLGGADWNGPEARAVLDYLASLPG